MLQAEEQQVLQEIEDGAESQVERQVKMKERVTALRERRERDRQVIVSQKMEQLHR